jgi:hypothetical protein
MNKELTREPERALLTTPGVYLGEASRAAASFNHAMQISRTSRRGYNRVVARPKLRGGR